MFTDIIQPVFTSLHSSVARAGTSCYTEQKMKFSIKDFFSKCDQIRRKLPIWSHLLKKSLIENFIFCAVLDMLKVNKDTERLQ